MNLKNTFQLNDKKDVLLIVGTILAPMTGLRVWKVGPGEVLCLLYCIVNYKTLKLIPKKDFFIRFWLGFLVASSIGALWGTYKYPEETVARDIITWIYLGTICVGTHLVLKEKKDQEIIKILTIVSYGTTLWYFALYQYSIRVSMFFLGAPLWFGGVRFTGGATNPHQVALLLCLCLVVLTWLLIQKSSIKSKTIHVIMFYFSFFLLGQTKSSTATMAACAGVACVLWQHIWINYKDKNALFIVVYSVAIIIVGFFGMQLFNSFRDWVLSDSNGADRLEIFSSFPIAFFKGPIFGLGPGNHARNGFQEFHNSYLEIAAMSGIVGTLFFAFFTYRLLKTALRNPVSLGVIAASYVYGLAGFGARRLVYWLIISLAYRLAAHSKKITIIRKDCVKGVIHG